MNSQTDSDNVHFLFDVCVTDPVEIDIPTFESWIKGEKSIYCFYYVFLVETIVDKRYQNNGEWEKNLYFRDTDDQVF